MELDDKITVKCTKALKEQVRKEAKKLSKKFGMKITISDLVRMKLDKPYQVKT